MSTFEEAEPPGVGALDFTAVGRQGAWDGSASHSTQMGAASGCGGTGSAELQRGQALDEMRATYSEVAMRLRRAAAASVLLTAKSCAVCRTPTFAIGAGGGEGTWALS